MSAWRFISEKLKFDGKAAVSAIAVSSVIIIVSLCISAGFRDEIRRGISSVNGDITLSDPASNHLNGGKPIPAAPSYSDLILSVDGVVGMKPAIYRAGVIKTGEGIKGVMFKGVENSDSTALTAGIPRNLALEMNLHTGDRFTSYFIGENVKARNFTVTEIWDGILDSEEAMVIYTGIEDLRRVNGWEQNEASVLEITLDDRFSDRRSLEMKSREIGDIAFSAGREDEPVLMSKASSETFPQLFDWISLIRANVTAILALMIIVAGFNMVSGLLIMIFRSSSTIGILKTLGMTDRQIAKSFLLTAGRAILKGLAIGNAAGIILCLAQKFSGLLKLDPESYFVSKVPISMDWGAILATDIISFVAILILLALPALFISRIDPADTVKSQ